MAYDFNVLEQSASRLMELGRFADAIKIFLFMSDGDASLDGGWLGWRLGQCYEALGDVHAAFYWHGRAVEENRELRLESLAARERLQSLATIDDLLIVSQPKSPPWP